MIKKALLTGSVVFLLIAVSLVPVTAQTSQSTTIEEQEVTAIDSFMDKVEQIASESTTTHEFVEKMIDLCSDINWISHPVIRNFVNRILNFFQKYEASYLGSSLIQDLLDKFSIKPHPDYLVISYGAYNRLNPRKGNSIDRFKEGLSMWRYSDTSLLLKGRTLIIERQPFGIHQKMTGPQLGFMKGFKGIYLDIKSKLTGNSYVFFMGHAHRIRAYDLTPFSR
jgi:hypothetical protein